MILAPLFLGNIYLSTYPITEFIVLTGAVRDRVKTLENLWKELNLHLDEKQRLGKQRTEQLVAYEKLRDQVIVWLNNFENRVEKLEPIAVDIEVRIENDFFSFHIFYY